MQRTLTLGAARARRRLVLVLGLGLALLAAGHCGVAYAGQLTLTLTSPNSYFSPNGDGQEDALYRYYELSGAAKVSVAIYTKGGTLVRTVQSEVSEPAGTQYFFWDGKDDASKTVGDGVYRYTITAASTSEGSASASQEIGVDTGAPGSIVAPKANATIKGLTTLTLKPTPTESVEEVEFRGGCGGYYYWYWNYECPLASAIDAGPEGSYSASANVSELLGGEEELQGGANQIVADVRYLDPFGESHYERVSIPVTVANPEKIHDETSGRYFSPNGDGQEDNAYVQYRLNSPGKVTITITNSADELVRTIASEETVNSGYNYFIWDGTNQSSQPQPNGLYKYAISASDGFGSPAVASGSLGIDRQAPGTITAPKAGATISGTTHFVFKPSGSAGVQSVTFYGHCARGYYCQLASSSQAEGDGTFHADASVAELINGSNEIFATVSYTDPLGASHTESVEVPVTAEVPETVELDSSDRYFGDDQEPTSGPVEYFLGSPGKATVTIRNDHGELVATPEVLGAGGEEGEEEEGYGYFEWDGNDSHGHPAPEGVYTYTITASDGVGAPASASGHLGLDRRAPASITAPTAGAHLAGDVDLEASMSAGYEGIYAEFYTCRDESHCRYLETVYGPSTTLSTSVEAGEFFEGSNELSARVLYYDPFGEAHWYTTAPVAVTGEGAAPVNTEAPEIYGSPMQGASLYAGHGTWTESPSSFEYQWLRCNASGAGCSAIEGATGAGYLLTGEDVGHTLRVEVVAENAAERSSAARSEATEVIGAAPAVPVNTHLPSITGAAVRGQTLSADVGSWSNEPSRYSYQWLRCEGTGQNCQPLAGATGYSLTLGNATVGYSIEVRVVAGNAGGDSQPAASSATATVTVSTLRARAGEAVNGTAGAPVQLDGSGSSPAETITGYTWEFGDGGSGSGAIVSHSYAQPGTYTATLKVTDGVSTASATTTVTVAPPTPHGLEVSVLDSANQPIEGAEVMFIGADGKKSSATSGAEGKAVLDGLPDGNDSLYVYKEGFQPAVAHASVSNGAGKATVNLSSGAVAATTLADKEMTLSEIEAAGIDTNDPRTRRCSNSKSVSPSSPRRWNSTAT